MKKLFIILTICAAFMFTYGIAYSAITVESVKGEAAVKAGNQWNQLQQGQTLAEGSKISTGVNSTAVLKINNVTLTIKPMTMMKIFKNSAKKEVGTHIGLKFGNLNAKVQKIGKLKTNFKISTPVATSSVRGTEENVGFGPAKGMTIEVVTGTVEGESNNGQSNSISGSQSFQIAPNDPKPDNLLSNSYNSAFQPLYDPNNIDEKPVQDFLSDDSSGSGSTGTFNIIDNNTPTAEAKTTVHVDVIWP